MPQQGLMQNTVPMHDQSQQMPAQQAPQQTQQQPQVSLPQVLYFDPTNHTTCVKALTDYTGMLFGALQGGAKPDYEFFGRMLYNYVTGCLRSGPEANTKIPEGATCKHVFSNRGSRVGQECGKKANFLGIEGLPKCSSHKGSGAKNESSGNIPSGASGQTFSYADNKGKGKELPQTATTLQRALSEATEPAILELSRLPDGRCYNPATQIIFIQTPNEEWIAIGTLNPSDQTTTKLTAWEVHTCASNRWKWDVNCVVNGGNNPDINASPLTIQSNNPLVSGGQTAALTNHKIASVLNNN